MLVRALRKLVFLLYFVELNSIGIVTYYSIFVCMRVGISFSVSIIIRQSASKRHGLVVHTSASASPATIR